MPYLRKLWRLGDIELPIGGPWFVLYRPNPFLRGTFWPIRWQGWAMVLGLIAWLAGSVTVFAYVNLDPGDWQFFGWLAATFAVWSVLAGIKTEVIGQDRD